MTKKEIKKEILFEPGFDYIVQPTKKYSSKYGRHGMQIRFVLTGKKGVVQFLMYTHWLPMVKVGEWNYEPTYKMDIESPLAVDIGYHSPKPMYKGQTSLCDKCEFLDGKPCYYDGSGLNAEDYMAELINKGHEALWKKMEKYYREIFK